MSAYPVYQYAARVIRVIDADTLDVELDLGFRTSYRTPLRVAGVNAPEHNTTEGQVAITYVKQWLGELPVAVTVETYKPYDKYGRYLADVWLQGRSLAHDLLESGHAVAYNGQGS